MTEKATQIAGPGSPRPNHKEGRPEQRALNQKVTCPSCGSYMETVDQGYTHDLWFRIQRACTNCHRGKSTMEVKL